MFFSQLIVKAEQKWIQLSKKWFISKGAAVFSVMQYTLHVISLWCLFFRPYVTSYITQCVCVPVPVYVSACWFTNPSQFFLSVRQLFCVATHSRIYPPVSPSVCRGCAGRRAAAQDRQTLSGTLASHSAPSRCPWSRSKSRAFPAKDTLFLMVFGMHQQSSQDEGEVCLWDWNLLWADVGWHHWVSILQL